MSKKLTVLMVSIDSAGHFNACIGIAEQLRDRGHSVVFAVPDGWKNKLAPLGFIEEWYNNSDEESKDSIGTNVWGEIIIKMRSAFLLTPQEEAQKLLLSLLVETLRQVKQNDSKLERIVSRVKPDIIVVDTLFYQPAIMNSGIPWVLSFSIQPLCISNKNVPPPYFGLPTGLEHKSEWESFWNLYNSTWENLNIDVNKWLVECGAPPLKYPGPLFLNYSPYANIYMFPEELDYTEFRPNPPNFYSCASFIRKSELGTFEIPDFLKNKPGKLVYFSMGTIGCSDLQMMKRLISILAKSPHRFIISKGPFAQQIELADNMWGLSSLPQTKVLPLVDLVISHGGNNTVTESFYFGKPLIILPLFGDQTDNAQRVMETGHGLRFHSHKVTEKELLEGIEKLLSDNKMGAKMSRMSRRIQSSNDQSRIADLLENIAKNNIISTT